MKIITRNTTFALIVAMLLACVVQPSAAKIKKKKAVAATVSPTDTISESERLRYDYFFFEGVRQQNLQNYAAAYDLFTHAISINPRASEAWYMQSMLLASLKKDSIAMNALERAVSLNPNNDTYAERIAQYYVNRREVKKAINAFEDLYENNRHRSDVLEYLLRLYQHEKDYDKMISTIERIELSEGVSEESTLSKMQVYELKGDKKAAYAALRSLCEQHPSDVGYRVMMGNWLMQNKREKEAYKIFAQALKEEPDNAFALSSLCDYYKAVGDTTQAEKMTEDMLISPKTDADTKIALFRQIIMSNEKQGGDSAKVLNLFDKVIESNPKDVTIASLKVAYMGLKHVSVDTINNELRRILTVQPDDQSARVQLIQNLWPTQSWEELDSLCSLGMQYHPEELAFSYFEALVKYQNDDSEGALRAINYGLKNVSQASSADLVSDFFALKGDILHKKGLIKESYEAYDSCLKWKEDNIACLNNYAYFLCEEGGDLQKAEQMSFKTVKAEPRNTTYLDTYAWILFMQERYAEAKIYIDQALSCDTDSVASDVILEHAGDIYAMNGVIDDAVLYWQKAADAGSENALLPKKIKLRQYVTK